MPHFTRGICAPPLIRYLLHARNCEITKGLLLEIERGAEGVGGRARAKRCYLKIAVCLEADGMGHEGPRRVADTRYHPVENQGLEPNFTSQQFT